MARAKRWYDPEASEAIDSQFQQLDELEYKFRELLKKLRDAL